MKLRFEILLIELDFESEKLENHIESDIAIVGVKSMRKVLLLIFALLMFGVLAFADDVDTNDHTDSPEPIPVA